METKQVIILRKDLNMRKGKMCAQAAHASVKVCLELQNEWNQILGLQPSAHAIFFREWLDGLQTKVCVGVSSEQELQDIYNRAKMAGLPCSLITDAGLTEFGGIPTKTAVAVGPGPVEEINKITGSLTLL
jgi:peptidyl-tRNA hydrolase, PTH2 family